MILRLLMVVGTTVALLLITAFGPEGAPKQCWSSIDIAADASRVSQLFHSSYFGALSVCTTRWTVVVLGLFVLALFSLAVFSRQWLLGFAALTFFVSAVGWTADKQAHWGIAAFVGALFAVIATLSSLAMILDQEVPEAAGVVAVLWEGFSWLFGALMIISLAIWYHTTSSAPAADTEPLPSATVARPASNDTATAVRPAKPAPSISEHAEAPGKPTSSDAMGRSAPAEEAATAGPLPSRAPTLLKQVRPRIPNAARQSGVSGEVRLMAEIDPGGEVAAVKVLSGLGTQVDEAVIEAVRRWRFEPALLGGRAVAARAHMTIEIRAGQPTGQLAAIGFTPVDATTRH